MYNNIGLMPKPTPTGIDITEIPTKAYSDRVFRWSHSVECWWVYERIRQRRR